MKIKTLPALKPGALCQLVNVAEKSANGMIVRVVSGDGKAVTCTSATWPEIVLFVPLQCLRPIAGGLT